MEEKEKKQYVNKRRLSGEYCQVHLQLPIQFNEKIEEYSKGNNMTKAAWVTRILEQVITNEGKLYTPEDNDRLNKIDNKLDTIINLIAKL